jgi:capsular polysaccharide biosynthesis protein
MLWPFAGPRAPLLGFEPSTPRYAERKGFACRTFADGAFVATIPGGRVLFDYGVAVTPENRLLADVSIQFGYSTRSHLAFQQMLHPPLHKIEGRLAVLSHSQHQVYYHWMFDIIPRLALISEAGMEADLFLANTEIGYQRDTLDWLGLTQDRVLSPQTTDHYQAEILILPSLSEAPGPTIRTSRFLRETFLPADLKRRGSRRLYVTRSAATTRRVVNDAELTDLLERLGFETVVLEGRGVAAQAALFADAQIVVGPHGAGMTNAVFCPPGAALIEFTPRSRYVSVMYRDLARILDLRYRNLISDDVGFPSHDLQVDLQQLERLIAELDGGR